MKRARASSMSFTPDELECMRMILADPTAFGMSELELRACSLVVMQAEGGGPVAEDYVAIARHLLQSVTAGACDGLAWHSQGD